MFDKCKMLKGRRQFGGINNSGYALITLMFFVVLAISVTVMAVYPLVTEPEDTTRDYITNMKFHRFKQALFGRMADQCAGKFMSCGGRQSNGGASNAGDEATDVYGRRHYIQRSGIGFSVRYPPPFAYNSSTGFWNRGYWGKRYVHPLPSDDWYDDYGAADYGQPSLRHAFLDGRGAQFFLHHGCNQNWTLANNHGRPGCLPIIPGRQFGMEFNSMRYVNVKVRDYSEDRDINRDFTLIFVKKSGELMDGSCSDPVPKADHILYEFSFKTHIVGNAKSYAAAGYSGHNKLLIRIEGDTKFTTSLVVPCWSDPCYWYGSDRPEITYKKTPFSITLDYH